MSEYRDILQTVVDNGRVVGKSPEAQKASLEVEVEFEAQERGLTDEEIAEAVRFAKAHYNPQ